jgi:hypothetical protein
MDHERHGWPALPPALRLGLGLALVQTAVMTIYGAMLVGRHGLPAWLSLASLGAAATRQALCAYGAAELAQRHTGIQRRGLQLASAGWLAAFVLRFAWLAAFVLLRSSGPVRGDVWVTVEQYSGFAVELLPAVGLAIAMAPPVRALGLVIVAVSHLPPFATRAIGGWLALDGPDRQVLDGTLALFGFLMIATLAVMHAPATPMPEPGRAATGLRRATVALQIWRIAVIVGTAPMLLALASRGDDAHGLYKLAVVAATAIHAGAFGWLAFGLLGAARDGELARTRLAVAGAASLWCGAVMLAQCLFSYDALYGSGNHWTRGFAGALALGLPLVALVGVAILASELGSFVAWHRQEPLGADEASSAFAGSSARRREQQLRRDATGHLVWIILLMLASAVIEGFLLPNAGSENRAALLMLLAAGCSLVALTLLVRLCTEAAAVFARAPGLPVARIVSPG